MPLSVSFREMERDWGWKEKKKVTHGRRIARATLEKKKIYISNDIRYCGASGWPKSDRRGDDVSIDRTRERQSAFIIDILVKKKEKKRNHDRSNNSDWFELTLASSFGEEGRFDKKKKMELLNNESVSGTLFNYLSRFLTFLIESPQSSKCGALLSTKTRVFQSLITYF